MERVRDDTACAADWTTLRYSSRGAPYLDAATGSMVILATAVLPRV